MDDAAFLESLRREFLEAAPAELDVWEENLLAFDKSGDPEAMKDLKRLIHSMKGSTQAIGLMEASDLLHELEQWLHGSLGSKTRTQLVSAALSVVDRLREYYAAVADDEERSTQVTEIRTLLAS